MAFSSLPSISDAKLPLKILWKQLFTKRFILVVLFGPLFILLSTPGLIISYISSKSIYIQILLCILYSIFVFLIGFEIIEIDIYVLEQSLDFLNDFYQELTK